MNKTTTVGNITKTSKFFFKILMYIWWQCKYIHLSYKTQSLCRNLVFTCLKCNRGGAKCPPRISGLVNPVNFFFGQMIYIVYHFKLAYRIPIKTGDIWTKDVYNSLYIKFVRMNKIKLNLYLIRWKRVAVFRFQWKHSNLPDGSVVKK